MAVAKKKNLPMLFLNGIILLPNMTVQVDIDHDSWAIDAVSDSMISKKYIFIADKKSKDAPVNLDEVERIGVVAEVSSITKGHSSGKTRVVLRGLYRAEITKIVDSNKYFTADVALIKTIEDDASVENLNRTSALRYEFNNLLKKYLKSSKDNIGRFDPTLLYGETLSDAIDCVAGASPISNDDKRTILHTIDLEERFIALSEILLREISVNEIKLELSKKIKDKVDKNQKEYVLREQLKLIKNELGYENDEDDVEAFFDRLKELKASEEVKERIEKEIKRCQKNKSDSSESYVQRNYVDTLLDMPWDKASKDSLNLNRAQKILDRDHYGLKDVKEHVIEFLAVRKLTNKGDSPILCLIGPPGTGKTSIARSIATALNKEYVRISLGGVSDEAEIRGHRRTYVGAIPGRIADGIKKAGVKNPLIVLDEVDKACADRHGDVSAALLEVLDSEQNSSFRDRYIDIPIDLSEVLFIATANDKSSIPRPLLDRMEVIDVSGYTANEKFHIAKDYLVKKQCEKNGIKLSFTNDAIDEIINHYTKESGVRSLERNIGKICKKAAKQIVLGEKSRIKITAASVGDYLGPEKYHFDLANEKAEVGIVRGLAWTQVGGDTLEIEVNVMPGKGEIILTGQMGDVMKESASIGISYLRSVAKEHGIAADFFKKHDFHIHIPEGAVPKDGPSAGITMATAILSAIINKPVREDIAMTVEITLRGRVLPIGGLKEKLLAAKMAGIKMVLVPKKNEPNVIELDDEIKEGLEIVFVETMDEVIRRAII